MGNTISAPAPAQAEPPRRIAFLLDVSGSMAGAGERDLSEVVPPAVVALLAPGVVITLHAFGSRTRVWATVECDADGVVVRVAPRPAVFRGPPAFDGSEARVPLSDAEDAVRAAAPRQRGEGTSIGPSTGAPAAALASPDLVVVVTDGDVDRADVASCAAALVAGGGVARLMCFLVGGSTGDISIAAAFLNAAAIVEAYRLADGRFAHVFGSRPAASPADAAVAVATAAAARAATVAEVIALDVGEVDTDAVPDAEVARLVLAARSIGATSAARAWLERLVARQAARPADPDAVARLAAASAAHDDALTAYHAAAIAAAAGGPRGPGPREALDAARAALAAARDAARPPVDPRLTAALGQLGAAASFSAAAMQAAADAIGAASGRGAANRGAAALAARGRAAGARVAVSDYRPLGDGACAVCAADLSAADPPMIALDAAELRALLGELLADNDLLNWWWSAPARPGLLRAADCGLPTCADCAAALADGGDALGVPTGRPLVGAEPVARVAFGLEGLRAALGSLAQVGAVVAAMRGTRGAAASVAAELARQFAAWPVFNFLLVAPAKLATMRLALAGAPADPAAKTPLAGAVEHAFATAENLRAVGPASASLLEFLSFAGVSVDVNDDAVAAVALDVCAAAVRRALCDAARAAPHLWALLDWTAPGWHLGPRAPAGPARDAALAAVVPAALRRGVADADAAALVLDRLYELAGPPAAHLGDDVAPPLGPDTQLIPVAPTSRVYRRAGLAVVDTGPLVAGAAGVAEALSAVYAGSRTGNAARRSLERLAKYGGAPTRAAVLAVARSMPPGDPHALARVAAKLLQTWAWLRQDAGALSPDDPTVAGAARVVIRDTAALAADAVARGAAPPVTSVADLDAGLFAALGAPLTEAEWYAGRKLEPPAPVAVAGAAADGDLGYAPAPAPAAKEGYED